MNPWDILILISNQYAEILTLRKRVAELEALYPSGEAGSLDPVPEPTPGSPTESPTERMPENG